MCVSPCKPLPASGWATNGAHWSNKPHVPDGPLLHPYPQHSMWTKSSAKAGYKWGPYAQKFHLIQQFDYVKIFSPGSYKHFNMWLLAMWQWNNWITRRLQKSQNITNILPNLFWVIEWMAITAAPRPPGERAGLKWSGVNGLLWPS